MLDGDSFFNEKRPRERSDRGRFFAFKAVKPLHNEARPRERSDRGRFLLLGPKKPLHTGVRTGCHYLIGLSLCMCDTRRFD